VSEEEIIEQVRTAVLCIEGVESVDVNITKGASTVNVLYKGPAKPANVWAELGFGEVGETLRAEKLTLLVHQKPLT